MNMNNFLSINNRLTTPFKETNWKDPNRNYDLHGLSEEDGFHLLIDNEGDITLWNGSERVYLITFRIPVRIAEKLITLKDKLKPIFSYLTDEDLDSFIEMIKFFILHTDRYVLYLRGKIGNGSVVTIEMGSYYFNQLTTLDNKRADKTHLNVYEYANATGIVNVIKGLKDFIIVNKTINQELGMIK